MNWSLGDNDRVFLSGYFGRDVNKFGSMFQVDYGNATGTFRWNHVFNGSLFSNFTLIYSDFNYTLGVPQGSQGFKWKSNIIDYSIRNDYTWYLNPNNTVVFGFQSIYHTIKPGVSQSLGESFISDIKIPDAHAIESGVFISNDQNITPRLGVSYGLRFSLFQNIGKGTLYNFDKEYEVSDTTFYESGEIYKTYQGLEPRLSIRYALNDKTSIKSSYNRMYQYMHLASNSTATFPLDMWFFKQSECSASIGRPGGFRYIPEFF
ncbi:MAG: hypothetical protein HC906_10255 [Bacteroidales bacterium]|nr:hypothetical protein [Bacteroidales bacterium]